MSNQNKRFKKFNKQLSLYAKNPLFNDIRQLYMDNDLKMITSAEKLLKKVKITKSGIYDKRSKPTINKVKELVKTSQKNKQSKEEARPIESFFKQINKSIDDNKLILNQVQQEVFRKKVLIGKYIVKIFVFGKVLPTTMTLNAEYVDSFIDLCTNHTYLIDNKRIKYSDGIYDIDYSFVYKYEFVDLDSSPDFVDVKVKKNKTAAFFNYLNTSELDLTRYQIIRQQDDGKTINKEQCLIYCFRLLNISESSINAIKLAMVSNYIPKSSLKKISTIIKKKIIIHSTRNNKYEQMIQEYGEYEESVHIGLYEDHYFVYENTKYNKYFIDNYDTLNKINDCFNILRTDKKGDKVYYRYGEKRCDSLYLINKLFEKGYFKKDTSIINSFIGSSVVEAIPLDNIDNEQMLYEVKEKERDYGDVFYADCESCVTGEIHEVLMIGVIHSEHTKPEIYTLNSTVDDMVNKLFNYVKKYNKSKLPPIIYFHNLKYDYMGLLKKYLTLSGECTKANQVYSVDAFHYGYAIKLRDSFKLANFKLGDFSKIFTLAHSKKEAIAYEYYNKDNINNDRTEVEEYIKHFKKESDIVLFNSIMNENKELFEYKEGCFNSSKYYKYYLEYDCIVLKEGINKYVNIINEITSKDNKTPLYLHDSLTISSLVNKYMSVNGAYDECYQINSNLREYVSNAVYGGRVNACADFKKKIVEQEINDYDCTSMYPSAMYRLCNEIGIPKGEAKIMDTFNENYNYFIGRFEITKINKRQQNPFIAIKTKNGIDYVNDFKYDDEGKQIPMIVTIDKITLEDYIKFHDIEYKFIDGIYWNSGYNKKLGALIYDLFESRASYKKTMKTLTDDDPTYLKYNSIQEIIKLMMNSVYGKTIIKKNNEKIKFIDNTTKGGVVDDNINSYIYNNFNTKKEYVRINDRQTQVKDFDMDMSFNLAHVGVLILSYSKRIINEVMAVASDNNIPIYYQDTDSMHLNNADIVKLEELYSEKYPGRQIGGDKLCQFHSDFKLKGACGKILATKSIFLGKKSYIDVLESVDKNGNKITGYHMRMKGISEDALAYCADTQFGGDYFELYKSLSEGNEIQFILNPYKHSVSFEYVSGGIRSRKFQEFKRVVKF